MATRTRLKRAGTGAEWDRIGQRGPRGGERPSAHADAFRPTGTASYGINADAVDAGRRKWLGAARVETPLQRVRRVHAARSDGGSPTLTTEDGLPNDAARHPDLSAL